MKKDFSKVIVNKIKKENIKQIPRCVFVLKYISVWFFLIFSIFVWALALSISFGYFSDVDWVLGRRLGFIRILTIYMPLFWIFFLVVSVFFSYYNFRNTERWYKFSFLKIFLINIFSSVLFGMIFYFTWISSIVESYIEEVVPEYRSLFVEDKVSRMVSVWQNEDSWLLIWEIVGINESDFVFIDYNNKEWSVLFNGETNIKWRVEFVAWKKIKVIWEKTWNDVFEAKEIRPFMGRGSLINRN